VTLIPRARMMKAQAMLSDLIDLLGDTESGLVQRMQNDERVQRLLWEAAHAAAHSDTNAKLRALSRVASPGVRDDAELDESLYKVDMLRELQVIDVRVLVHLAELSEGTNTPTSDLLAVSAGVAYGLNAKLIRLGLADTGGVTFGANYSLVHITAFGREVLSILRECGDGDPLN